MKELIETDPALLAEKQAHVARILNVPELNAASDELASAHRLPPAPPVSPALTDALNRLDAITTVPALPGGSVTIPAPKMRKKRADAGQPRAAKPKPTAPESVPVVAPVAFSLPLMLGVDITTDNGQRDVMALLAIWLVDERHKDVATLFASLLRKFVAAEKRLAAFTTPAA